MTFSLVKDLVKWIEVLSRSVVILVGSDAGIISDIGDQRKENFARCQISSSKILLCSFMKNDFQSSQGLVQMD